MIQTTKKLVMIDFLHCLLYYEREDEIEKFSNNSLLLKYFHLLMTEKESLKITGKVFH